MGAREEHLELTSRLDPSWAATAARRFAAGAGMDGRFCAEVAILVAELSSNIIKFAGRGTISLRLLEKPTVGIEIIAEDEGAGFVDPVAALEDTYSEGRRMTEEHAGSRRGLGAGLGAVQRLSDELSIENLPRRGARCVARKWARHDLGCVPPASTRRG